MDSTNFEDSQKDTGLSECSVDIFDEQIEKDSVSKTARALSIIYSILIGLLTNFISSGFTSKSKKIGIAMSLCSYLLMRAVTVPSRSP